MNIPIQSIVTKRQCFGIFNCSIFLITSFVSLKYVYWFCTRGTKKKSIKFADFFTSMGSQTGPCVLIRWPRYIYFPMDECTQPIRSILIIRPRFGAIHLYTEKQDKTQKVWLMFLCPKNILHRFNLPSWHFWKTIIIGNQISSFVEKHATHLKRFSFQIV